jgi:hypothetical protein
MMNIGEGDYYGNYSVDSKFQEISTLMSKGKELLGTPLRQFHPMKDRYL